MEYVVRSDYTKEREVGVKFVWRLQTLRICIYVFVQANALLNIFPVQISTGIWWPSRDFWRPLGNLKLQEGSSILGEHSKRRWQSSLSCTLGKSWQILHFNQNPPRFLMDNCVKVLLYYPWRKIRWTSKFLSIGSQEQPNSKITWILTNITVSLGDHYFRLVRKVSLIVSKLLQWVTSKTL